MVEFKDGHPREESHIPDGVYMDLSEFSEEHDIPAETVRTWVKRKQVPSISYYGRIFIPERCSFATLCNGKKAL